MLGGHPRGFPFFTVHEDDAVLLGVLEPEPDVGPAHGGQGTQGVLALGGGSHADGQLTELAVAHRPDELVLVGEVQVDGGRGDAHGGGDGPDGDVAGVAAGEELLGGVEDLLPEALPLAPPGAPPAPPCGGRPSP